MTLTISQFVHPDDLRAAFCTALSNMYRSEVPLYGDLVELVDEVNSKVTTASPGLWEVGDRLRVERHGAIRLGRPCELAMIARLFRLLGMFPVGYYDLSTSGVPVHATAFRPIDPASLDKHPFRVFTSLLRPELILDEQLREQVEEILDARDIFHPEVRVLIAKAEQEGGVRPEDKEQLVEKALETFKWHEAALVTQDVYERMKRTHPLLADIAGFKGPHINHLTPRVLDIDMVQRMMAERGQVQHFCHELYQTLMSQTGGLTPTDDNDKWQSRLSSIFSAFPDSWHILRTQRLAYFRYKVNPLPFNPPECMSLDGLIEAGVVTYVPMVYEDFLPASAAGIFQSNLGEHEQLTGQGNGSAQGELEKHIGAGIVDYFDLYEQAERDSLEEIGVKSFSLWGL
ncbi:hypothetical protein B9479_000961 [Cryptococcus floricola]|uniref:2-oxoadipate dioxygenase/decarboxylase n=1 Tax=Cryptococcus floricola TaxID=2591691 RepID=A0A5D3B3S6_9TREE|nr:hypothetical protein B9479_000961 [Cryptococcus floricola]